MQSAHYTHTSINSTTDVISGAATLPIFLNPPLSDGLVINELELKQALEELIAEKAAEIARYEKNISTQEQAIDEYEAELAEQTELIAQIEAAIIEEQKRIADILDKFYKICTDLCRRTQYSRCFLNIQ